MLQIHTPAPTAPDRRTKEKVPSSVLPYIISPVSNGFDLVGIYVRFYGFLPSALRPSNLSRAVFEGSFGFWALNVLSCSLRWPGRCSNIRGPPLFFSVLSVFCSNLSLVVLVLCFCCVLSVFSVVFLLPPMLFLILHTAFSSTSEWWGRARVWWQVNHVRYPNLYVMARQQYLGCPEISASVEPNSPTLLGGVGGRSVRKKRKRGADAAILEAIAFTKLTLPRA